MIGIFDSGYGGLTVFKPLIEKFSEYDFIYFGDNAQAPYGDKSQETIYKYTREAIDWLFKEGSELVILACNTASSQALRKIQQEFLPKHYPDKKILGVLIPVAEEVSSYFAKASKDKQKVGILATEATVKSGSYSREILKLKPDAKIIQAAATLLVPLIEEGKIDTPEMKEAIKKYLADFKKENVKNIVLGCTHYPLIKHLIQAEMPDVHIFDSPSIISPALENYFVRHAEIEKSLSKNGVRRFITTGDPEKFSKFAKNFLSIEIKAERIALYLHFLRLRNSKQF